MENDIYYKSIAWSVILMILIPVFFAPTITAIRRRRRVILVLIANILIGWTFFGWGIAMAIAIAD